MTIPTRDDALRALESLHIAACDGNLEHPGYVRDEAILRSYIESHTGEPVCPRSANGRPENFTVRECVAAGECGCGESVTPGSTVRASPVQPDPTCAKNAQVQTVQPALEWDGPQLLFNGRELGDYFHSERGWRYDFMGDGNATAFVTDEEAKVALESEARQWLSGGDK